jgi:DNA primase
MDTEEMVQIIGPNENMEEVEINKTVIDEETGKEYIVNDLSVGKYGVSVQSGPAAATRRQETVQQLSEFTAQDPEMKLLAGDVLIGNMDLNDGEELKKRFRKRQIDQGIVDPTDEEKEELGLDQPPPPDPMQEALIRNVEQQSVSEEMKQAEMAAKIESLEASTQKAFADTQKVFTDSLKSFAETLKIKQEDLGLPIDQDDAATADGIQGMVDQATEEIMENEELAGSMPIGQLPAQEPAGPMPEIQPGEINEGQYEDRETPININPPTAAEFSKG